MRRYCPLLLVVPMIAAACGMNDGPPEAEPQNIVSPLDRLPGDRAGEIIRRSIDFHSGPLQWPDKRTVEHRRTILSFDEDGNVARETIQHHRYDLANGPRMRIEWEADEGRTVLINNGEQAWKFVDGRPAATEQDRNQAWNSTFGSHYVFWMPFKLTDPGAMLEYAGQAKLDDGTVADMVTVSYEPGAGSAGGMHTWTYYFSTEDGRLVANHLHHGPDGYSFTEYHDYRETDGVYLPGYRVGYESNANHDRVRKITEIRYHDIRFNVPMADELFEPLH